MFFPPILISPEFTSQNLAIKLQKVVFPDPDGPTTAVKLFSFIEQDTSFKISLLS